MMFAMIEANNAASGAGSHSSATDAAPGSAAKPLTGSIAAKPALTTTLPGVAEGVLPAVVVPEFVAMPSPGKVCPYSGLQRGMLYSLLRDGLIRSVTLRRSGKTKSKRLIVLASLREYLRRLDAEQNATGKED